MPRHHSAGQNLNRRINIANRGFKNRAEFSDFGTNIINQNYIEE
jgi:hypothetical protein